MYRKKTLLNSKALVSLLIGIFVLSGCGQSGEPLAEATDSSANVITDMGFAETESKAEDGESSQTLSGDEPAADLPTPSPVPVNTNAEDIDYYVTDDFDPQYADHRCCSDGENIYLPCGRDLYIMPIGTDEHSRADIDNSEGLYVCNIAIDACGRLHLLMTDQDSDKWLIWRLDEDFQIDRVIDISAYFETKWAPIWFLVDKDGTYYIQWVIDRDGILVDSDGMLTHRFTLESLGVRWTYEAAVGRDGQIWLVYRNEDKKVAVGELDVENGSIKAETSPLCFPDNETFSRMSAGTDTNLLFYRPYSGVWACDSESGVMENRVPLSDIGFDRDMEVVPLTFLPDGRLLLMGTTLNYGHTEDDGPKHRFLKYLPAGR